MSRYLAAAQHLPSVPVAAIARADREVTTPAPDSPQGTIPFVVKLRDRGTRMWGNEVEMLGFSAQDAAERAAGEKLRGEPGQRVDLRARVWKLPHGSVPETQFFTDPAASH